MGTRRVTIYGGNLIMSTIGASLQQNPKFQVQQILENVPNIIDLLEAAPPDVILFDLAAGQPQFVIHLLRVHPEIALIGVDLMKNEMLVVSGEQSRLLTARDLSQVVIRKVPDEGVDPVGMGAH